MFSHIDLRDLCGLLDPAIPGAPARVFSGLKDLGPKDDVAAAGDVTEPVDGAVRLARPMAIASSDQARFYLTKPAPDYPRLVLPRHGTSIRKHAAGVTV